MFCHFVEKQSAEDIDKIGLHFPKVFEILMALQIEAMRIFDVDESEIRVMPEEKCRKLQEERDEFTRLLLNGLLDDILRHGLS